MKFFLIFLLLLSSVYAGSVKVAVAANVNYAMADLKKEFERLHPATHLQITLGSSGKLTAQILHGAPYDIFLSADMAYPEAIYQKHLSSLKPVVYARGTLVCFSVKKRDFSKGLALLQTQKIKKIAIANPKTAPYGKATKEALQNAKLYETLQKKFVYGESIAQTVSYTLNAADIGFIAKSSLFSKQLSAYKKEEHWIDVENSLYSPINQGMVLLKRGEASGEVKLFYDFMLSEAAKKILQRYGYILL